MLEAQYAYLLSSSSFITIVTYNFEDFFQELMLLSFDMQSLFYIFSYFWDYIILFNW